MTFVKGVQHVRQAVVAIGHPAADESGVTRLNVWGSGFCVGPDGVVATCSHVVLEYARYFERDLPERLEEAEGLPIQAKALTPWVLFFQYDPTKPRWESVVVEAKSVAAHRDDDIAFIGLGPIDGILPGTNEPIPFLELVTEPVDEGEEIGCSGFPLGDLLMQAARSATRSFHFGHVGAVLPHPFHPKPTRYQLDLFANPGNSGGPVFRKSDGKVIGILNARMESPGHPGVPTGISFAVPSWRVTEELTTFRSEGLAHIERMRAKLRERPNQPS